MFFIFPLLLEKSSLENINQVGYGRLWFHALPTIVIQSKLLVKLKCVLYSES